MNPGKRHFLRLLLACSVAAGCGQMSGTAWAPLGQNGAPDFVSLAKQLQPAVVNVSATVPAAAPNAETDLMERFFGVPPPPGPAYQRSQGSGFIIGRDGIILTNAHVVQGAKKIVVKLFDKREFEARVIGRDLRTDVALIKIATNSHLPTIKLGDSEKLQVGEWVMAIGNPFGLDSSVSSGIISGKERLLGEPYDRLIQTDASVNPGSSGGPLVNLRGEVVGINKAILSQLGGGSVGIGFATPINLIKEILPQLETTGKVSRGWAGMAVQEITPSLAETLGLQSPNGALVAGIVKGGPADRSGIKVGDVITEYDGKKVTDALELPLLIARTPVAKQVEVKVEREKQALQLPLTVAELPEEPQPQKVG
ncbi:MAG TPA: trypsin-like peptidase domain-containing protein [Methylomirabilota bacterium]|nr:trypsin-like peptidase domain-containing protein [Methylomirabilota bacterium]